MKTLQDLLIFMSQKYDNFIGEIATEKKKNELRDVIVESLKTENSHLHKVTSLEDELHLLQKYSRNKNVEIHGVEEKQLEDLDVVLTDMARSLHLPLQPGDAQVVHRLKSKVQKDMRS